MRQVSVLSHGIWRQDLNEKRVLPSDTFHWGHLDGYVALNGLNGKALNSLSLFFIIGRIRVLCVQREIAEIN